MKKTKEEVENEICYSTWYKQVYRELEHLFLMYAMVQLQLPGEINVGQSEYIYLDDEGFIEEEKISKYELDLKERMIDYEKKLTECKCRYEDVLNSEPERLICGKYLLHSLARYLRTRTNKNFREDDFKYFLLSTFDVTSLNYVKERIVALV